MGAITHEHDLRIDFHEQLLRGDDVACYYVVRRALRSLQEISSLEVITGDDHRLRDAQFLLRLMRDRIDP